MSMLLKILFFWLPSRKAKPTPPKPKRSERSKRTKKK